MKVLKPVQVLRVLRMTGRKVWPRLLKIARKQRQRRLLPCQCILTWNMVNETSFLVHNNEMRLSQQDKVLLTCEWIGVRKAFRRLKSLGNGADGAFIQRQCTVTNKKVVEAAFLYSRYEMILSWGDQVLYCLSIKPVFALLGAKWAQKRAVESLFGLTTSHNWHHIAYTNYIYNIIDV